MKFDTNMFVQFIVDKLLEIFQWWIFDIDEHLKSFSNELQNLQTLMNFRNLTLVNFWNLSRMNFTTLEPSNIDEH
jgi:hypothetical protein